ncbi:MAG: hypothetical protein GF334_03810, partial [Candidatus Altiarchaeales archaeon]|nr:hypothetical protein [Candidatus Altiarchaeales archaeon]
MTEFRYYPDNYFPPQHSDIWGNTGTWVYQNPKPTLEDGQEAQQQRSARYGINIRDDGNINKPSEFGELPDSQWGDPVNYLYPVPDKEHAKAAKTAYNKDSEEYDYWAQRTIRGRLNRLARKYGIGPIKQKNSQQFEGDQQLVGKMAGTIHLQDEDEDTIVIDAARKAVMFHPWFGPMYLDDDFFESMIDNWQTDVLGTQVAIDAEHRRGPTGGMALAWVTGMMLEGDVFRLKTEPTQTGLPLLGNEYKYASIEFWSNFVDQETLVEYGPVLAATAATNIPFVHRNNPIQPKLEVTESESGLPVVGYY